MWICASLQPICEVSLAQVSDVDKAVAAAKEAFEEGEWGKMNPRDRGRLIYRSGLFLPLFADPSWYTSLLPVHGTIVNRHASICLLNQTSRSHNVI